MSLHRAVSAAAFLALGTVVGGPALVACGSSDHGSTGGVNDSGFGHVRADLSATGPDGATYSLGSNVTLNLTPSPAGDAGTTVLQFTPGLVTQAFSVPAGNYTATLNSGNMNGEFTLGRSGDGGATSVMANITDTQPYNITVPSGGTTNLTFHFQLLGIGNVTFGTGSINTAIAVAASDGGAAQTGSIVIPKAALTTGETSGPNAPASFGSFVSMGLPANFPVNFSFNVTGPFVAGIDDTCAPVQVTTPISQGGSGINDEDFFDEAAAPGGTGQLCLYDSNGFSMPASWTLPPDKTLINPGPYANAVVLSLTRTGAPWTMPVMAALGASTPSGTFSDYIIATPNAPLYDGTTASLTQLAQPLTVNEQAIFVGFDPGTAEQIEIAGGPTGAMTVQLSP